MSIPTIRQIARATDAAIREQQGKPILVTLSTTCAKKLPGMDGCTKILYSNPLMWRHLSDWENLPPVLKSKVSKTSKQINIHNLASIFRLLKLNTPKNHLKIL